MEIVNVFSERVNVILGVIVALLSYVLGEHWFLFVAFLTLNVIDYVTGCLKSRIAGKINSKKGAEGALKKLGYWLMIMVAFIMVAVFQELGVALGFDLGITIVFAWFLLATLIINELRSIIENFVEIYGDKVPKILTRGLEIASKVIEKASDTDDQNDS